MDLSIVNHLFLTQRFLVKGNVRTGELRLTSFLNSIRRPVLAVENVTLLDLARTDRIVARQVTLRLADVLLAHEYVDLGGDRLRKKLGHPENSEFRMVSAHFRAPSTLEVLGRVRRELVESSALAGAAVSSSAHLGDEFFVMMAPLLRGFAEPRQPPAAGDPAAVDLESLKNLSYAIVNRAQIHCWFEYE